MKIKGKIKKIGFLSGTFNILKEDISQIAEKVYCNVNKDKIIGFNQMET